MFKKLLITTLLFSSTASFCSGIVDNNVSSFANYTNIADSISRKYQSNTIDIAKINFENIFNDVAKSGFANSIRSNLNIKFDISRTNDHARHWIYRVNNEPGHGVAAANGHANKIVNDISNLFIYPVTLTVIAKVARYYGDNTSMNPFIRQAAISKIIYTIINLKDKVRNSSLYNTREYTKTPSFGNYFNNLSSNLPELVRDVVNKKYTSDLFTKYSNVNYSNLKGSGVLSAWDTYCKNLWWDTPKSSYNPFVWDSFFLGSFKIHILTKFHVAKSGELFWNNTYFYLDYPIFDIEM